VRKNENLTSTSISKSMAIAVALLSATLSAQTVRPVISELGNPAKGRIEYYNDSLTR
jgi:hypothetical protein